MIVAKDRKTNSWMCPRCGSKRWRVTNTYTIAAGIRRRRVCQKCGQSLLPTIEKPDRQ